jgi:ketosteroid isomerase-like protein
VHVDADAAAIDLARPQFEQPRAEIEVAEKLQSDGLAFTHARWRLNGTDAEGQSVELSGDGTIVSRQQADGSWLIVLDNPVSPR